jgi:hypothetical protein
MKTVLELVGLIWVICILVVLGACVVEYFRHSVSKEEQDQFFANIEEFRRDFN